MDYIREEMERQRLAMELLLDPSAGKQLEELSQEDIAAVRKMLAAAVKEGRTGKSQTETEETLETANAYRNGGAADETESVERMSALLRRKAASVRRSRLPGTESEPRAVGTEWVLLQSGESAGRLTAKEVSRAVERDARRYDGGYQMY